MSPQKYDLADTFFSVAMFLLLVLLTAVSVIAGKWLVFEVLG